MKRGRMLREGDRRSPRISALDLWKAQPPRRTTVAKKTRLTRSITSTSTSTAAEVQDKELDQQKENQTEGPACMTRAKKKRKLKPPQDVASTPNSQQVFYSLPPFYFCNISIYLLTRGCWRGEVPTIIFIKFFVLWS
jgi:bromodomain-containing protein 7/9